MALRSLKISRPWGSQVGERCRRRHRVCTAEVSPVEEVLRRHGESVGVDGASGIVCQVGEHVKVTEAGAETPFTVGSAPAAPAAVAPVTIDPAPVAAAEAQETQPVAEPVAETPAASVGGAEVAAEGQSA